MGMNNKKEEKEEKNNDDNNHVKEYDNSDIEDQSLVIKMLRPELLRTKKPSIIASIASDLVKEGAILAGLNTHPNVLRLIGCTKTGIDGFFDVVDDNNSDNQPQLLRPDGFVLVLERLSGSLTEKFSEWRHHSRQLQREHVTDFVMPHFHHHHHHYGKKKDHCYQPADVHRDKFWIERLDVVRQIASGIDYIHSKRIVHRDLKPDNIGFDYRNPNVIKIFDFNVARKLPSPTKFNNYLREEDELFRLTHNVGSRRYMAPEVGGNGQSYYNQQVDVYSFGLIAYQILALPPSEKVYPDIYTVEQHEKRVFQKGERPHLPSNWPSNLHKMIERSWSDHVRDRPSAKELKDFFTAEINLKKMMLAAAASSSKTTTTMTTKKFSSRRQLLIKTSKSTRRGRRTRLGQMFRSRFRRRTHANDDDSSAIIDSSSSSSSCWSSSSSTNNCCDDDDSHKNNDSNRNEEGSSSSMGWRSCRNDNIDDQTYKKQ